LFSDYAYTPQPDGLRKNLAAIVEASQGFAHDLGQNGLALAISGPLWFGFQVVDVFVLLAGFVLVLSLHRKAYPLSTGEFIGRRLLRILWPFWTVAWLAYPVLWLIGVATNSYRPSPWDVFAGSTYPLLFDFEGKTLANTSGPWWFIPLVISFALISPLLWYLLKRWGDRNLLIVTLLVTLLYRYGAVYHFGGHVTYSIFATPNDWLPFLSFLAKLSTFVVGMVMANTYYQHRGPLFWQPQRLLGVGVVTYAVGFVAQFYRAGWVVCDLLMPIGIVMCCMVVLRSLSAIPLMRSAMRLFGAHSYSFFLIHGFVIDRTLQLWVRGDLMRYWLSLPMMILSTFALALVADGLRPWIQRMLLHLWRDIDYLLSLNPTVERSTWRPAVGDRVRYQRSRHWIVLKIETLLDDGETHLCQIDNGQQRVWAEASSLVLIEPALDSTMEPALDPTLEPALDGNKAVRLSAYSNIKTVV
jgi:peptidoglycan/LPS O-acetylase OafA/YrhL